MKVLTVRVSLNKIESKPYVRVLFNGNVCASDVLYIENLFYFLKNGVLPTDRIPNMVVGKSQQAIPRTYFDTLLGLTR